MMNMPQATVAPECPALTTASAAPSLTRRAGHLDGGVFFAPQDVRGAFVHVHHVIGLHDVKMAR